MTVTSFFFLPHPSKNCCIYLLVTHIQLVKTCIYLRKTHIYLVNSSLCPCPSLCLTPYDLLTQNHPVLSLWFIHTLQLLPLQLLFLQLLLPLLTTQTQTWIQHLTLHLHKLCLSSHPIPLLPSPLSSRTHLVTLQFYLQALSPMKHS